MSEEILAQIIERASRDASFRAQLARDPERALAGYDLTAEERAAVLRTDAGPPQSLGVDARISKQAEDPTIPADEGPLLNTSLGG